MRAQSRQHRDAMIKEYKRREENKKELLRQQKEKEEQKRLRKEQRNAARERHRIGLLLEKITATTIGTAAQDDFNPSTTRILIFVILKPRKTVSTLLEVLLVS
jgi:hypothetical protein